MMMLQNTSPPFSVLSAILLVSAMPGTMTTVGAVDLRENPITANNMTETTITSPSPTLVVDAAIVVERGNTSMLRGAQPLGKKELKLEDLFATNDRERPHNDRKLWGGWIHIKSNYDGEGTRTRKWLVYWDGGVATFADFPSGGFYVAYAPAGGYYIQTEDFNYCLDNDFNAHIANMYSCHWEDNQIWHFYGDSWSNVEIVSEHDQKCLDESWGNSEAIMWDCHGMASQRFEIVDCDWCDL
jgi:hypothetical protein